LPVTSRHSTNVDFSSVGVALAGLRLLANTAPVRSRRLAEPCPNDATTDNNNTSAKSFFMIDPLVIFRGKTYAPLILESTRF
jgi:hypothetical protein